MKHLFASVAVAISTTACAVFIAGCGSNDESPAALETARETANANSRFNAAKWRGENGYESTAILARGDSTQQPRCPQGDGWASVDLLDPKTKQVVVQLKCSTYSANVGCSTANDFKARSQLATQENSCSVQVPYPLKKIEQ